VFNVHRMMAKMSGVRIDAESSADLGVENIIKSGVRGAPDVGALAGAEPRRLTVMLWHYHDDDVAGPDAAISLALAGLPTDVTRAKFTHYRIDQTHSNTFTAWQRMGSPAVPDLKQYAALEQAGNLATLADAPATVAVTGGKAVLDFPLPRQAVSLLVLEW